MLIETKLFEKKIKKKKKKHINSILRFIASTKTKIKQVKI